MNLIVQDEGIDAAALLTGDNIRIVQSFAMM